MPWAAFGPDLEPSVHASMKREEHVAGPVWLAPKAGNIRPSAVMDFVATAPQEELEERATSGIWTGPQESKAEVAARIRERSEKLARRLQAVRLMLNKHLQQDGPSEFAAAVFEQRDYDAVYHGATAPRSSVQHIYGPADEGSPAGVAPRSRDSAFRAGTVGHRRNLQRRASSWAVSKAAVATRGIRGGIEDEEHAADVSESETSDVHADLPAHVMRDAANRQSALLREMMKEQNGMYDVSSKRGSEPYGGTSVHIRSSMQQNRGSQALPCAIEGKLLRNSQSYRSVPKAEAPIVFTGWVPVSQYHACISSDELLPLYHKPGTSSTNSVIHVKSPTPDFKRLNHSAIAERPSTRELQGELSELMDPTDFEQRPETCAAVLQMNCKGTQGAIQESSFPPVPERSSCNAADEEIETPRLAQHYRPRPASRGGVSKTTQNQRPHTQPQRPASRQAWQRGCLGRGYAARFTRVPSRSRSRRAPRSQHSRTPSPTTTDRLFHPYRLPNPHSQGHSNRHLHSSNSRVRSRSPQSPTHSPGHSRTPSPPRLPSACQREKYGRPVYGTEDGDAQLLLAAWHHHKHQGCEPLRKALANAWDWGWANNTFQDTYPYPPQDAYPQQYNGKQRFEGSDTATPRGHVHVGNMYSSMHGNLHTPEVCTPPAGASSKMRARPLKQQSQRPAQARQPLQPAEQTLALDMRPHTRELVEEVAMHLLADYTVADHPKNANRMSNWTSEGLQNSYQNYRASKGTPGARKLKPGKAGDQKHRSKAKAPVDNESASKSGFEVLFGVNLKAKFNGRYP